MMRYKSTSMLAILVMCASFAVAHADVKYTIVNKDTFVNTSDKSKTPRQMTDTSTYFVASEKSRREDVRSGAIYTSREVFISRCDMQEQFRLDDNLKIYTVSKLVTQDYSSPATASELEENIPEAKIITHCSIRKLAPKKINGFDTQCYEVTMTTKSSGYIGNSEQKGTMKMWVADVSESQPCDYLKAPLPASYTHILSLPEGRRRIVQENTGDVEEMSELSRKLPIRIEGITSGLPSASSKNLIGSTVILMEMG